MKWQLYQLQRVGGRGGEDCRNLITATWIISRNTNHYTTMFILVSIILRFPYQHFLCIYCSYHPSYMCSPSHKIRRDI